MWRWCAGLLGALLLALLAALVLEIHRLLDGRHLCEPLRTPLFVRAANKTDEAGFESLVLQCDIERRHSSRDSCVKCVEGPGGLFHIEVQPFDTTERLEQFFEPYELFHYQFRIVVVNDLSVPTSFHWHGLTPPNGQDGVAYLTEPPIEPGSEREFIFRQQSSGGMFWIHAHYGLQAGLGLWIPLVLQHPRHVLQEYGHPVDVVVMAEDRFRHPYCAFSPYLYPDKCDRVPIAEQTTINYYVNRRSGSTVVRCDPGSTIRLRLGNAGSESPWTFNFSSVGQGEVVGMDGSDLQRGAFVTSRVLATAQRDDVLIRIPEAKCYPIVIYAGSHRMAVPHPHTQVVYLNAAGNEGDADCPDIVPPAVAMPYSHFDRLTRAKHPLAPRAPDRRITLRVTAGDQFGGFSLNCPFNDTARLHLCTEHRLFLPAYRAFLDKVTGKIVRSRRPCKSCESLPRFNESGIINGRCWEWAGVESHSAACDGFQAVEIRYHDEMSRRDLQESELVVCRGERVEVTIENAASIEPNEGHPMHLHGHIFELRRVDELVDGQWRVQLEVNASGPHDTIWVPWNQRVVIQFDAGSPGSWLFHCHNDFHLFNGMATKLSYRVDSDEHCNYSHPIWAGNTPSGRFRRP